jgi:hypothetical protein
MVERHWRTFFSFFKDGHRFTEQTPSRTVSMSVSEGQPYELVGDINHVGHVGAWGGAPF